MHRFRLFALLLIASILAIPATASAASDAAAFRFEWTDGTVLTGSAVVKNGVSYIGMEAIVQTMAFGRVNPSKEKKIQYEGFRTRFTITIGKTAAELNGKTKTLAGAPFKLGDDVYVPAKFLVEALRGTKIGWDPKQRIVSASGLHKDRGSRFTYSGLTFLIDHETGKMTMQDKPGGAERKIADLGSPLYDIVTASVVRTEGNLLLITIEDDYGEPHLNHRLYQLVLKNRGLIRQSSAFFYNRAQSTNLPYDGYIVLTSGKQLRLIEDGTGNVLEKIDLTKLGGEDTTYYVEGIGDEFILLRPSTTGMLKLYDRRSGEATLLYKELLDPELFEIVETYTAPMVGAGDYLTYVGREGDSLLFRNDAPYVYEQDRQVVYRYSL